MRWALLWMLGCQGGAGGSPVEVRSDVCAEGGDTEVWVLQQIRFPREESGISPGFDIDGVVTEAGDGTGCGVVDYLSPDGTPGIDNAFARLRPALDTTEASALDAIVLEAINSGGLLAMVELHGVSDPSDDACVDMVVTSGLGTQMIGNDGFLLPGQTFDPDPAADVSEVKGAAFVDGVLEDGPVDLRLPFSFLDADVVFTLLDGRVRLERHPDGRMTGTLGGGVAIQEISDLAHNTGIDETVEDLLDSLLGVTADLAPDEGGLCQQISITLELEAVRAFYYPE